MSEFSDPSSPRTATLLQVHKARPSDKDAKTKYKECDKIVKQKAFEKAISVEAKTVDLALDVEATLDGMSKNARILLGVRSEEWS